jgi:Ca-activated chloride channel homolog
MTRTGSFGVLLGALLFLVLGQGVPLRAQSYRSDVNEGNELYRSKKFDRAREKYRRADRTKPDGRESRFNDGNAAYRSGDIKGALESYEQAGRRAGGREDVTSSLYNAGTTFLNAADQGAANPILAQAAGGDAQKLRMEGYRKAIDLYKQALKLDPAHEDARYNLAYAQRKLEQMQQQQQNKNDKQQKKKDQQQNKQQQKKDDKNKDDKQKQQQQQPKQDQQQKQQQRQQPQRDKQMSQQQADQILNALQRQEQKLQKEKRQQVGTRSNVEKDW